MRHDGGEGAGVKGPHSAPVVLERGIVDYSHCDDKGKEPLGMCLCVHMS